MLARTLTRTNDKALVASDELMALIAHIHSTFINTLAENSA